MSKRTQVFLTITVFVLATVAAKAAGTTAFDGTYAGVSMDVSKRTREAVHCPQPQGEAPQPLTIKNGVVRPASGKGWTGTVSPHGALVIRNQYAMHVHAQIDPQGSVTGEYHGSECVVKYTWRKQPG